MSDKTAVNVMNLEWFRAMLEMSGILKRLDELLPLTLTGWAENVGLRSLSRQKQAALEGRFTSDVVSIKTAFHTTPGDNGGASYIRISVSEFASYMFSPTTETLISFYDASGDVWILNERSPELAMVGCFGQPLGQIPIATSEYDCTTALLALAEYGVKRFGAVVVRYGNNNYYFDSDVNMPDFAGISGPSTQGNAALAVPDLEAVGGVNWIPGLVLRSGKTLKIGDNFYSDFLAVKRAGIVIHTDAKGALDAQLAYVGIGVTKTQGGSSRNVKIKNFVAYGFAFGMDAYKMHGLRLGDVFGDCTTLVMVRSSGETVYINSYKRKPILTNNAAVEARTVQVTALYNYNGQLALTLAEDVIADGLTTGQRLGNQKLPDAINSLRRTALVLDATHVVLQGIPWDSAYSTFPLNDKSSITWQAGCSSGVVSFYNANGKVGVNTIAELPFVPGHQALLLCDGLPQKGMKTVLTRVSATNFILDVAWNDGLNTANLIECELTAMPNNRTHNSIVSYWNTNEGFAIAAIDSDGIRVGFANKGGSGFYCNSGSVHLVGSNEGGSTGETDLNDPNSRGLVVRQPRVVATGAWKSTGTAYHVDMENHGDVTYAYGMQLTDNGSCSLRLTRGRAVLSGVTTKGPGRVILDDPTDVMMSRLTILHGDITPDNVIGTPANKLRSSFRWDSGTDGTVNQIAGRWVMWAWNPTTGVPTEVLTIDYTGLYAKPKTFSIANGALTITKYHHDSEIDLTGVGNGISIDATTLDPGFKFRVRNHRTSDWNWPTSVGAGVVIEVSLQQPHTKIARYGMAEFTVMDIPINGVMTRHLLIRGDTKA